MSSVTGNNDTTLQPSDFAAKWSATDEIVTLILTSSNIPVKSGFKHKIEVYSRKGIGFGSNTYDLLEQAMYDYTVLTNTLKQK
jgi:hypothetical protein